MLRSTFIVSVRNLIKNSLHTSINIFGLTIGIAACFSIFTLIRYEYSFNNNHPDSERIYRVYSDYSGTISGVNRGVTAALAPFAEENFTGLENIANFHTYSAKVEIPLNDGSLKDMESQGNLVIAGSDFIDMVGQYDWLSGTKQTLESPFKVVLIESQAIKYFGNLPFDEMLGKEIIYRDSLSMEVGGVVSDIPDNTDFQFTDILSFPTIKASWLKDNYSDTEWGNTNSSSQLFVKLAEGTPVENLEDQLESAVEKGSEGKEESWNVAYKLQPLSDLHYNTEIGVFDNVSHSANLNTLQKLTWVAIALLVIAAINFINLETALATKRSAEVGIRKVLGSSKVRLVLHFLNESFLVTTTAVLLSIPLIYASLNIFEDYLPEGIQFNATEPLTLGYLGLTILIVGLLAGLYPAFVMSSFTPIRALKSKGRGKKKSLNSNLRKGLTIFQFGFSQVLILSTVIIGLQIHFMTTKELGFKSDSIIYFYTPYYEAASKKEVFRNELSRIPEIDQISNFSAPPAQNGWSKSVTTFVNENGDEIKSSVHQKSGDSTYVSFFGIELLAGRNFRNNNVTKETVINETFARELGFDSPIDAIDNEFQRGNDTVRIVGVAKDFYFQSLHNTIEPLMIFLNEESGTFGVKLVANSNATEVIDKISAEYAKIYPDRQFNHYFLDETVQNFYKSEKRASKLAITATVIAIIVSCLGLFGLASFTTIQRTKEIGIRKVLGATSNKIVGLLSIEFLKLVFVSIVLAIPFAYWVGNAWLEDFAYKISLNIWLFIICGVASILIAFITVAYQSVKAALANPADSLRYE